MAAEQLPDLKAKVRVDTSELTEAVSHASKVGSAIGSAMGGLAAGGIARGVEGLKDFATGAVDAFAAVEDATGAAGVEFGNALPQVVSFADKAAQSFGLSKRAALEAQNTFGTLGKAAGLQGAPLAGFSQKLTGLAGDLASFKGTSTEQAITAVGAALRGESEPIRAYGVLLNDASIQAEGLALGLVKPVVNSEKLTAAQLRVKVATAAATEAVKQHGKGSIEAQKAAGALEAAQVAVANAAKGTVPPLTATNKTMAIQSLILKQTKDAQGDYTRTASSTANVQKTLAAETENAQAQLGAKLAPAVTALRQAFLGVIRGSSGVIDALGSIIDKVQPIAATIGGALGPALKSVAGFFRELGQAIPTPVLGVLGGLLGGLAAAMVIQTAATAAWSAATSVAAAVAGLFATTTNAETGATERGVIARVAHNVATVASTVAHGAAVAATAAWTAAQWLLNAALDANPIGLIVIAIAALVGGVILAYNKVGWFHDAVNAAFGGIKVAVEAVIGFFSSMGTRISSIVGGIVDWIKGHWTLILGTLLGGPFGLAVALIVKHWDAIKGAVSSGISAVIGFVTGLAGKVLGAVGDLGSKLWEWAKSAFVRLGQAERDGITKILDIVKGLPGRILSAVGDLGSVLFEAGKKLIQGLIDGIGHMFGAVKGKLGDLTGKLTSWKGPPSRDATLLFGAGESIIGGFIGGLESRYTDVRASLGGLTDSLSATGSIGFGAAGLLPAQRSGINAPAAPIHVGAAPVSVVVQLDSDEIASRVDTRVGAQVASLVRSG